jgi:polysaccharide biosynthesis protein PslG
MRPASLTSLLAALVLSATAASCSSGAQANRQVPRGFIGVLTGAPIGNPDQRALTNREVNAMASSGVESLRTPFYWRAAQPDSATRTDFTPYDRIVGTAARNGIDLLPTVLGTPRWARRHGNDEGSSPEHAEDFANFMVALIGRYGPRGSFWAEHHDVPRRPIRRWQLYNEPDHKIYWAEQPYYKRYVELLDKSRQAMRRADPGAKVVLAGLVGRSWDQLRALYRAGAKTHFDYLAVHPFTRLLPDVLRILRYNRAVARGFGDGGKPMLVTELTWPSSKGRVHPPSAFDRTQRGQASLLREAYRALAKRRVTLGIRAAYWATWLGDDRSRVDAFDYTGLSTLRRNGTIKRKPAYFSFRATARLLEGCTKSSVATKCR